MERLPALVIPAYRPDPGLLPLVEELLHDDYPLVVVVNDGSGPEHRALFERLAELPRVEVVTHLVNLGKGEALKTGLNHLFVGHPDLVGAVTVDADGQHLPADVKRVAKALVEHPESLCLGTRSFDGAVPWKSRIGNTCSRWVLWLLSGQSLRDTQTGLRGIPRDFVVDLLPLRTARYEFELEMLLRAAEEGRGLVQVPIRTVYRDDNRGSHFDPLWDSLRVYFVFLRFLVSSLLTAIIDFTAFSASYALGAPLLPSVALGRVFAGAFNFLVNRSLVFRVGGSPLVEAAKYVALVLSLMTVSYVLTLALVERGVNVFLAKVSVETSLFLVSFAVQRVYVFVGGPGGERADTTDWDAYYRRPAPTARLTRRVTVRSLLRCLRLRRRDDSPLHVLELGGGNSCFYDAIRRELLPARYTIVDDNDTGLALFERQHAEASDVSLVRADVRALPGGIPPADVCFSVGLIEHFDEEGTRAVIDAHFESTRPGGLVVLLFPTPTWLYRLARRVLEGAGLWAFPDERPLPMAEVLAAVARRGRILERGINWSVVLTQGRVAAQALDDDARR